MLTIVWDVDDVLNDLMAAWFRQCWLPAHPDCRVTYAALRENPPHAVLGIEKAEYLLSLDRFRSSDGGRRLAPNPEILRWMGEHGHRFRHMALTARPLASAGDAAEWVFRHFGNYIRCYGVAPVRLDAAAAESFRQLIFHNVEEKLPAPRGVEAFGRFARRHLDHLENMKNRLASRIHGQPCRE